MAKKPREPLETSKHGGWFTGEPRGYESVVLIHGILGDQIGTWGDFPHLLEIDNDLPKLDILLWGYETGAFFGFRYLSIEQEANRLMSGLEAQLTHGEPFVFVAHSMGGLIALQGITENILGEAEDHPPVEDLALVTLYATPLGGSFWANLLYPVLFWLPRLTVARQVGALTTIGFVSRLAKRCKNLIDCVDVPQRTKGRRMTVRSVQGLHDSIVGSRSAVGTFAHAPRAHALANGHGTIKLPRHHRDDRYRVLKVDLARKLRQRLYDLAVEASGEAGLRGARARQRIARQYSRQLEVCALVASGGKNPSDIQRKEAMTLFINVAASEVWTPEVC